MGRDAANNKFGLQTSRKAIRRTGEGRSQCDQAKQKIVISSGIKSFGL